MNNLKMLLESQTMQRAPFPVPTGWYFVDYSENLKPGEFRNINQFGQEWVFFRTEGGRPAVADPYCPHLGAHLGHGGKVCGEHLRCPFHHWEYDADGMCKVIPYATVVPPITQRGPVLRTLPTVERYGMIWSWYHPRCEPPAWDLPPIPEFEEPGYVGTRRGSWAADTCIQEIAENGVDFAHLRFLHGVPEIPHADVDFEKHIFKSDIGHGYIVSASYGPGLNVVRFTQQDVTSTMISYTVPITHEKSQMNMSFRYRDHPPGSPELAIAKKLVDHMIGAAEGEESEGFESVDFIVWNNKRYRPNPLLCDGDGPILPFRKWFRQFYTELNEAPAMA